MAAINIAYDADDGPWLDGSAGLWAFDFGAWRRPTGRVGPGDYRAVLVDEHGNALHFHSFEHWGGEIELAIEFHAMRRCTVYGVEIWGDPGRGGPDQRLWSKAFDNPTTVRRGDTVMADLNIS